MKGAVVLVDLQEVPDGTVISMVTKRGTRIVIEIAGRVESPPNPFVEGARTVKVLEGPDVLPEHVIIIASTEVDDSDDLMSAYGGRTDQICEGATVLLDTWILQVDTFEVSA